MYEKWADPKCPICHGAGSHQNPEEKDRLMRIACECVNQARDIQFVAPLVHLLGTAKWDKQVAPAIQPARHALVCGDFMAAAPDIYRTVTLWRRAETPWSHRMAVVTGETILDYQFKRDYAETMIRDHHLVIPMLTVIGNSRTADILGALSTLMTSPPSCWPKFTLLCLSPLGEDAMAKRCPQPNLHWQTFRQLVRVYQYGPKLQSQATHKGPAPSEADNPSEASPDPYEEFFKPT